MTGPGQRGVFIDRDGILNELVVRDGGVGSPRRLADFRIQPNAPDAVRALRRAGFRVLVVTNQPDLARGLMDRTDLEAMLVVLRGAVPVDDVAVCPHDDADDCGCRKPKPGMLLELAARWGVDLRESCMVGDTWRDIGAGRAAGCRTILVGEASQESTPPDLVVRDLPAAVAAICDSVRT